MKCVFIYNPKSGKSGIVKRINYIERELTKIYGEVDIRPTQYPGHAMTLAKEACGVYDYLVVSGGDGTFNEIVNGLAEMENAPIVGYLPSGTVNDISRSLSISRNLKKGIANLRNNLIFHHDIFKVNDRYGIYFCGAGAFTSSSYDTKQNSKKFWGKVAYFFHGVKELLRVDDFNVKISDDNGVITKGKYIMMLIVNSRSVAGFKLNKNADLSDGGIDVILIKRKNKVLNYMSSLFAMASIFLFDIKNLKQSNNITRLTLDEFKIELSKKKIINVDGERGPEGNADFKVIKKGLKVIVPFKTIKKQSKIKLNDRIREQRELERAVIKSREFDYRENLKKERERKLKEFQAKLKKGNKDKE